MPPDGERVTTGSEPTEDTVSEPRRPRVFVHDDDKYVSIGFTDTNDTLLPMPEGWRDKARVREWADAVNALVVESGHDEQTEGLRERLRNAEVAAEHARSWNLEMGGRAEEAEAALAEERERTVAAVVETLRERALTNEQFGLAAKLSYEDVICLIEERFKPFAPGGGNA